MAETLIAFGNVVDDATLAGGSPVATMPLENLQDPQLGVKWRTLNLAPSFKVDFEDVSVVRVVSLAHHNIGIDGKIRIRGSEDPAFPVTSVGVIGSPMGLSLMFTYAGGGATVNDTGWLDVWPPVYNTEDLEWEADNFWSGKFLKEDIEAYNTFTVMLPQDVRVHHWLIEIDDPGNDDGFIEAGRLFMAPKWQPVYNANFGATLGWETGTEVQSSLSGAEYFDVKTPYRVAQMRFDLMTESEGLSGPFEIMRKCGIHGEILFMWDPDDTIHAARRQFLGRFRVLNPLEFPEGTLNGPYGDLRSAVAMEIKERVA